VIRTSALVLALVTLAAAFAAACAESSDLASDDPLLVDLKAVESTGVAQTGDGIRTAGQPTEAALRVFADSGFKTIIDLRGTREKRGFDEKIVIASLGMRYLPLPISGPGSISVDNARKLDQLIEQSAGPILIHCASGNRVGALLALSASMGGASNAAALQTGRDNGLARLEPTVRKILESK